MNFISNIIPELFLVMIAILVLISDLFTQWRSGPDSMKNRIDDASSFALLGLGLTFLITLHQSGFLGASYDEMISKVSILENLRGGGRSVELLGGSFSIDMVTHLARLLFVGAAFITILLTRGAPPSNNPGEFYALILLSTLGMILMAGATELTLIYLGIELTSIPLYILAGYFRRSKDSTEAGVKYYIFGALSSAILLFGISLVLGMAMTTTPQPSDATGVPSTIRSIAESVRQTFADGNATSGQSIFLMGLIFIIAGMAYKIAIVPFHSWSPDVYQGAPTTMTAFISTASKTAGFLLLFRILVNGFGAPEMTGTAALPFDAVGGLEFGGWTLLLAVIASLTMLVGNLAALPQTNVKRLLAYSSIAHAGFLLLGMVGISRDSGVSLMYYLVVYTLTNLGAFGVLALLEEKVGGTDFSDLNGVGKRAPGLTLLLTIFVLSLAGIPPLSGFFAKFYIFIAAWQEGAKWLVIFAVSNTVISLYYYLRVLKSLYIHEGPSREPIKAPFWPQTFMVITMVLVLVLGLIPGSIFSTLERAAVELLARR